MLDKPLAQCHGALLAGDLISPINMPPHANSAMDGICLRGDDLAKGTVAIPAGTRLAAPQLGLAASLGLGSLPVRTPLKVALFITGDERAARPRPYLRQQPLHPDGPYPRRWLRGDGPWHHLR